MSPKKKAGKRANQPSDELEIDVAGEALDKELGFISSEESDEQIKRMQKAAKRAEDKIVAELAEVAGEDVGIESPEAQADLAQQIAEDDALEATQAQEAEAATLAKTSERELDEELQAALPSEDSEGNVDLAQLISCIEALLFMSERPQPLKKLREYLGPQYTKKRFDQAIAGLKQRYNHPSYGIELKEIAGGYQLRTKGERAALSRLLSKTQPHKLSRGAMESLAIIAYKQPVMKDEIDKIRGVDSSHFIRGLMDKKLIQMSGRSELPGRPMLYGTTTEFLEIFGLNDLDSMPPLRELEAMIPTSEASSDDEEEDPKVTQLRELVHQMNEDKHRIDYDPKEDDKILTEFRENVKEIPITTPYLDEQAELEKSEKLAAAELRKAKAEAKLQPELAEAAANAAEQAEAQPAAANAAEQAEAQPAAATAETTADADSNSESNAEVAAESEATETEASPLSAESSDALKVAADIVKAGDQ